MKKRMHTFVCLCACESGNKRKINTHLRFFIDTSRPHRNKLSSDNCYKKIIKIIEEPFFLFFGIIMINLLIQIYIANAKI